MSRLYRSLAFLILVWLIGSCGGGDGIVGPPPPTVASVTLSRDTATLVPAATLQLTASARTATGETLPRSFSWSSSDTAKVTVSNSGMVVGIAPGTATISATTDGKSASTTIAVLDGGVVSSTGGTLDLEGGAVQIVVPVDALASNTNLSVAISTTVAGDPRVIRGTALDFGPAGTNFAKPVALKIHYDPANLPSGTEEAALELYLHTSSGWEVVPQSVADLTARAITAPVSHFSTYAILTPEAVAGIAIDGASHLTVGESKQLTATLTAAGGGVLTNRVVTWSTSNAAIASISQGGNVVAVAAGSTTVSASAGGTTSSVPITVDPVPVAAVTLSAPTTPMTVGGTESVTAMPKDAKGVNLDGRTVTWVSSNPSVLTVSASSSVSTSSGATVTVTAVSPGTATITATSELAPGATTPPITVNPAPVATVTVTPPSATLVLGITPTQKLTAVTTDANDHVVTDRLVTWSSSSEATATVDANGLVTAVAPGSTTITATSETKTGTSGVTVIVAPVATVTISPPATPMADLETQQLTAVTRDANNNVLKGRLVTWSTSNPDIAWVDGVSGVVTAVSTGTIQITASCEGKSATVSITVIARVASVVISPESSSLETGNTLELSAILRDLSGYRLTRPVAWSSANPNIASVDSSGLVTGEGVGSVTITATSETKTGTATVSVRAPTPPPITLTNEPSGMTLVSERPFNSLAEDATWLLDGFSLIQDGTAPKSPSGVLRATYPAGFDGGTSPGYAERGFTESRNLYISYWAKLSSNFYGHETGVNKQVYAWANGNAIFYFQANGYGTGKFYPWVVLQDTPADAVYSANLAPTATVPRGQWYQVEIVLNGNSAEAADGSVDWWLNGVHVGSVSGIRWTAEATSWNIFSLRPIWGGVDDVVPATMTLDFDHVYVSARPRVTAVTVTPSSVIAH